MQAPVIRLGLIGTGTFASRFHFPAICQLRDNPAEPVRCQVSGVWDIDQSAASRACQRFGFPPPVAELDALLENPSVDAFVVIVGPAHVFGMLKRVGATGKPFFTEKPPGQNAREARLLAESLHAPNLVAFNRRYAPLNVQFRERLLAFGQPYRVQGRFYRHARRENAFLRHTGIHGLNFLEWLCGPIERQETQVLAHPADGSRAWTSELQLASGVTASCAFFPSTGPVWERWEIHTSEGLACLHAGHFDSPDYPGRFWFIRQPGQVETVSGEEDPTRVIGAGFLAEHREFLETAVAGGTPRSHLSNAWNALRIAEEIEGREAGDEAVGRC